MKCPRVIIAGTASGSGKTTAVCALLTLLKRRQIGVRSCKCGPDYIDTMFHRSVLGIPCTNLDPFFCSEAQLRGLLARNAGQGLTVIEGVMGYYDGTGKTGTEYSTYTVARETGSPVVLVLNARGASASLLATIEGFRNFLPDSHISGVIFNQITPMTYQSLVKQMAARFGDGIRPIGYLPKLPENCQFGSRHLGLVTAAEIQDLAQRLDRIADLCAPTLDLDALLAVAETAEALGRVPCEVPALPPIHLAVARDAAFCFYYEDTLRLFRELGAKLLPFSPLADEPVPEQADGLLLGGGYPELYASRLEANRVCRESVRDAVCGGMPTIAECGGFQYLGRELEGHSMCNVLAHESHNTGKLVRFGYVTLTSHNDDLFGPAGMTLPAHEFHYYDSTDNGNGYTARKPNGTNWECAAVSETLYAGYPHLYLPAVPDAAVSFYRKCITYHRRKENL